MNDGLSAVLIVINDTNLRNCISSYSSEPAFSPPVRYPLRRFSGAPCTPAAYRQARSLHQSVAEVAVFGPHAAVALDPVQQLIDLLDKLQCRFIDGGACGANSKAEAQQVGNR